MKPDITKTEDILKKQLQQRLEQQAKKALKKGKITKTTRNAAAEAVPLQKPLLRESTRTLLCWNGS